MSNQKQGQPSGLEKQEQKPPSELKAIFDAIESRKLSYGKLLPKGMSPTWFAAEAKLAIQRNPGLKGCTRDSLFDAITTCAQLGLSPSGRLGSAYLIPFKTRIQNESGRWVEATVCQLVIGYRGKIDLAHRSGEVANLHVEVVYEGEEFIHEGGLEPRLVHLFDRDTEEKQAPDRLMAVYAVATMKGGYKAYDVLYRADVSRAKSAAKGANNEKSPWKTHTAEMWKKTAINRLVKKLPLSPERAKFLADAEEAEEKSEGTIVDAAWTDGSSTPALPASGVDALEATLASREAELVSREPGDDSEQPPDDLPLPTVSGERKTAK